MPLNVVLVGANGNLGSQLLPALLKAEHKVTILQRANSSSKPPSANHPLVTVKSVDGDFPIPELTEALKGYDAVIAAFPLPRRLQHHLRLAYATAAAGVKRFIPADWGSCDAAHPEALKRLQIYRDKVRVRERCDELTREFEGFTWTALVCGHFFDWGLKDELLHFDIKKEEATILDGGNVKCSASTLFRVGEALNRMLAQPDDTANRCVFVQSFNPTQLELLAACEKATGTKWTRKEANSTEFMDEQQKLVDAGDDHAVHEIVFALGTLDADWTQRKEFSNGLLGLEDESLDEVVQRCVDEVKAGK